MGFYSGKGNRVNFFCVGSYVSQLTNVFYFGFILTSILIFLQCNSKNPSNSILKWPKYNIVNQLYFNKI